MLGCRRHPDESHEDCYWCDLISSMDISVQGCNLYGCKQEYCPDISGTAAPSINSRCQAKCTHACF